MNFFLFIAWNLKLIKENRKSLYHFQRRVEKRSLIPVNELDDYLFALFSKLFVLTSPVKNIADLYKSTKKVGIL